MSLSDIINEDKAGHAYLWLGEHDHEYAQARVALEHAEILRKRVRARIFLTSDGTVAERQAQAETASDTQQADDDYIKALAHKEQLHAVRQRAELTIEVWRSLNANQRRT